MTPVVILCCALVAIAALTFGVVLDVWRERERRQRAQTDTKVSSNAEEP